MKNLLCALIISGFSISSIGQIETPQPSPAASIGQTIGLTEFTIDYSRPGAKDRKVFGELVPFGEVWRTGANKAVQFEASTKFKLEGKDVEAGKYALFTVPNDGNWDIILYEETEIWGTPGTWVDSLEVVRVNVKTAATEMVESFTMDFDNVSNGKSGNLNISWEKTTVAIKIEVPTDELALASIEGTMGGPSANDYHRAATYYHENDKDLKQAYEWSKKANELREDAFWMLRRQALIEADLGDKKAAIETAKKSLASAEKAKYQSYIDANKKSIEEWSK